MGFAEKDSESLLLTRNSGWRRRRQNVVVLLLLLLPEVLIVVFFLHPWSTTNLHDVFDSTTPTFSSPIGNGRKLRIMALGDSITAGTLSAWSDDERADGNGYRLLLRNQIIESGVPDSHVDFVGTQRFGLNNSDCETEAYPNKKITYILQRVVHGGALQDHPNLVLLHAGTNDMNHSPPEEPYQTAHLRLGVLIDEIICHVPEVVVIVSKIINNDWHQDRTNEFNSNLARLVANRQQAGQKLILADNSRIAAGRDKVHPDGKGYDQMTANWMTALRSIPLDWLVEPQEARASAVQSCPQLMNWEDRLKNVSEAKQVPMIKTIYNWFEERSQE